MPDTKYRVYFGDSPATLRPATQEEYDRIEEITVEQEIEMVWETRLRMVMCLDENGNWHHRPDEFAQPFSRVRIEVQIGTEAFEPLIDGPIASFDSALDSQPGRSTVTLVVRDDSVFLNREESNSVFEGGTDADYARQIFGEFAEVIGTMRVDSPDSQTRVAVRRGTAIQFLRELARAHNFRAYVLPALAARGKSSGCFLPDPTEPGELPPLTTLGDERNVSEISFSDNSERPQRTQGRTLRLADAQVVSYEAGFSDAELMNDLPPIPEDLTALRQLPPETNDREDPASRARAETRRNAYAYRATGKLVPGCYPKALSPYQKVSLQAGPTPYSGIYLLTKVTHTITPSLYTQEFEALGNSSPPVAASGAAPGAGAGGGFSVSFSASISIF